MEYFVVPVNDGVLDIDYAYLAEGVQNSETSCYVELREGSTVRNTWQAITKEQFDTTKSSIFEPPE